MKKLLLTMRAALLMIVVCAIAMPASADVTVYVLTKSGAPYIHAWTSSGDLTTWPGEQLTDIENINGVYYWKKVYTGINSINMILNNGGNDSKTNNIEGVTGTVYYQYDNYETAFGIIPSQVKYIGDRVVAYYASASQSENVTAQVRVPGSSTDWTAVTSMEKVGVDGAGHKVYRIDFGPTSSFGFWGNISNAEILFWVDNQQVGTYAFKNYGYYSPYHRNNNHSLIIDGWTLNTNRYNNTTLVNALKERAADYYDSSTNLITTSTALSLDLSGKSISVIENLTDFSNLRNLDISDNAIGPGNFAKIKTMSLLQTLKAADNYPITYGDLSQMTQLRHLDMHGNSGLKGFGTNEASSSNPILNIANGVPLQYVNLSNCNTADANFYLLALKNRGSSVLDTLLLAGNTSMGWKSDIASMTHLKYLDLSNTGLSYTGTNKPILTNLTNLETLILAKNNSLRYADVSALHNLKYYDIGQGDLYFNTSNQLMSLTASNNPNLETLIINSAQLSTTGTVKDFQNLKYIDVSGNGSMTNFAVSNCPALEEINFTNDGAITSLALTNNGYNNTTQPMPTLTGLSASSAVVDLSDNQFTAVPGAALSGVSVKSLKLNNNKIASISGLENMGSLVYLYLENQTIPANTSLTYTGHSVPQRIELSNNPNFTSIDLSDNQLKTVFLKDCSGLKTLDVSGNLLNTTAGNYNTTNWESTSNFCLYVGGCTALESLDASDNNISTFGASGAVDDLTNLETLNLANNNFSSFGIGTILSGLTSLKTLNLSGNKIYSIASSTQYSNLQALTNLESVDLSNNTSGTGDAAKAFHLFETSGLAKLKNVTLTGNFDDTKSTHSVDISGSPLLETVNVTGETALGTIDLSSNGLSSPVTITGWTTADAVLKYNDNDFTAIPTNNISANVSYLYLLRNEFQPQLSFNGSDITYKGVALSNKSTVNPITSFTAAATAEAPNTTLEAINLDGNTSMTDLTVNYFDGLTQTASDADMTTAAGKGLYIKGLSALENIDISHNAHFEKFGQDGSTTSLSAVKTFDGSHNAFYTFSNKTAIPAKYYNGNVVSNGRDAHPSFSTLEDLTALETLKLNDNQLCDSVHLWQNRNLKYLDLSNNRTITERAVGDYRVYRKGDGTTANWAKMVADRYTGDTNDTVGLRMLDLFWNQNLEYINISNTAIQNTAKDHYYMCNFDNPGTTDANSHPEKVPHYILVNRCKKLLEFHADNNGMKSLGIGSNPRTTCYNSMGSGNVEQGTHTYTENGVSGVEWVTGCPLLEKVSVKGARGQDPNIMMGELNISANNPNVWYYDASGGNFDYIGTANGANLKYLDVSGNYQSANEYVYNSSTGKWESTHLVNGKTYTTQGNPYTLNTNNNPLIETIIAQNCPALQTIVAQDVDHLTTFDVTQQPGNHLTHVYIDHNAVLPGLIGLETLSELNTLWVNDDPAMAGLNVTANTKLECLHAQNNPQFGETETKLTLPATSSYLKTLWVSGDNLGNLNNDKDLCVSGYENLDSLICDDNNLLYLSKGDNLATNTKLRHLNCDNNKVADLSLSSATLLEQVKANNNDLFTLALGASHPNLVELKFANNHVNGINLAGATALTQANYDDTNNGRQITANHQKFYTAPPTQGGQQLDLYYFQLVNGDPVVYGNWVCNETSGDAENHATTTRRLGDDGFDASKWASATVSRPNQAPRRTPATSSDVNADKVYGTIAVLTPTAEGSQPYGTSNYEYDNGNSNISSNFHLDWTASPTVLTGIEDVPMDGTGVTAMQGGLVVEGAVAGQVLGIYDLQGREVRREVLVEGRNEIDLPAGVYIVNGNKVLVR
ncbi:MAG: leucine-rich repeat domain-containing protein [Muribaculaceae bacterium]|nr:leucine-rich repeat domain-containing protein [Muribaculaceae bacterium]